MLLLEGAVYLVRLVPGAWHPSTPRVIPRPFSTPRAVRPHELLPRDHTIPVRIHLLKGRH